MDLEGPCIVGLDVTDSTEHLTKYINDMLYAAGVAARNMPKLQTMKIWQGRMGHVCDCVFRYQVTDDLPKITLWHFPLESRVVETWEAVALECTGEAHWIEIHQDVQSWHGYDIYHPRSRVTENYVYASEW